jgi:hypothetical protein
MQETLVDDQRVTQSAAGSREVTDWVQHPVAHRVGDRLDRDRLELLAEARGTGTDQ